MFLPQAVGSEVSWADEWIAVGTVVLAVATIALAFGTLALFWMTRQMAFDARTDAHEDRVAARRPVLVVKTPTNDMSLMLANIGLGPAFDVEITAYSIDDDPPTSSSVGVIAAGETPARWIGFDTGTIQVTYKDVAGTEYWTQSAGHTPEEARTGRGTPPPASAIERWDAAPS